MRRRLFVEPADDLFQDDNTQCDDISGHYSRELVQHLPHPDVRKRLLASIDRYPERGGVRFRECVDCGVFKRGIAGKLFN